MARKEFYLNLNNERVVGIDDERSSLVVAAMREGIKLGQDFPAVGLSYRKNDFYVVQDGHHRALAHYAEGSPCKCIITGDVLKKFNYSDFIIFDNIILGSDLSEYNHERLARSLSCLPTDIAEKFCHENDLSPSEYLSQ